MLTAAPAFVPTHPRVAELERLGDQIAELSAHLEAAAARLLDLIREFDARSGWNTGFRSCAAWLAGRAGVELGAARERVRVARALGTRPRLREALGRGELSYAKVRALTRVATPETEADLLAIGRAGTAAHVERIVRGWRRVDQIAEVREAGARHRSRTLQVYQDEDGMVVVRGRLEPEAGAVLLRALEAAREALYQRRRVAAVAPTTAATPADGGGAPVPMPAASPEPTEDPPTIGQQRADALALLAESDRSRRCCPSTTSAPSPRGAGPASAMASGCPSRPPTSTCCWPPSRTWSPSRTSVPFQSPSSFSSRRRIARRRSAR
jgi:hypothetical protein